MARYIVYGAGAIGGTVGASLFEHGHEVTLIARGPHLAAILDQGLKFDTPEGSRNLPIPAVDHPAKADISGRDVVLLSVKSQDTVVALQELAKVAPSETPVVCMQNGVANEPRALRFFENVYGMLVRCPAAHVAPGEVVAFGSPVLGIFDLGRYPSGVDEQAEAIAADFDSAGYSSIAQQEIMAWKYVKLVHNLQNACEVVLGKREAGSKIATMIREEGLAAVAAAGIAMISDEEMAARRKLFITNVPAGDSPWGSSSLQSVIRDVGSIESDYLNGEIALLGRLYGVPTPANALLQRLSREVIQHRLPSASLTEQDLLGELETA